MTKSRPHISFALVAGIVLLAALGPINPFTHGWGGETDDFFEHVNLMAWQAHQAGQGSPFPLFSRDIAYPDGGCMFLPDPIGGTASILFVWIFGVAFAHNLLVFTQMLLAGLVLFAVVYKRTGDWASSTLGGIAYAVCPVMLGNIVCGIDEILQALWLPLVIDRALVLVETLKNIDSDTRRVIKSAFWLGTLLAVNAVAQWYYGIYGFLAAGLIVAVGLLSKMPMKRRGTLAAAGLGAAAFGGILIAGPAWLFTRCFSGGQSLFYLGSMDFYITQPSILFSHSADPAFLLRARPHFDNYLHLGYVGFTLPALLAVAVWRKLRLSGGLAALALLFALLSFGPLLGFHGKPVLIEGKMLRLPYYFLYKLLPFFKEMRLPYRFFLAFYACSSLALGLGLAGVWTHLTRRKLFFTIAAAALIVEILSLSGAPWPMTAQDLRCTQGASMLQGDEGAVFDLPMLFAPKGRGKYLVDQSCHHRPVVYGVQGKDFAPSLRDNYFVNLLYVMSQPARRRHGESVDLFKGTRYFDAARAARDLRDQSLDDANLSANIEGDIDALAQIGVTTIAWHRNVDVKDSALPSALMTLLGEPEEFGDLLIYSLE